MPKLKAPGSNLQFLELNVRIHIVHWFNTILKINNNNSVFF